MTSEEPEFGRPRYTAGPVGWEQGPEAGQGSAVPRTEPYAVFAFVVSILAWAPLPVVGAVWALRLSRRAGLNIEAAGGALDGVGLALTARRLAWASLFADFVLVILIIARIAPIIHFFTGL